MMKTSTPIRAHAKHPQVAARLRRQIAAGVYQPGAQLPHREVLEVTLGAGRATVQTAMNQLLREGFLRSVSGQGTFIADRPPFMTDYALLFPLDEVTFGSHRFYRALQQQAFANQNSGKLRIRQYFDVANNQSSEGYQKATADVLNHRLAGLIFASPTFLVAGTPLLTDATVPRVVIANGDPNAPKSETRVYPNLPLWLAKAMDYVAARGRKRLAVLSVNPDPQLPHAVCTLAGDRGMSCKPSWVIRQSVECPTGVRDVAQLLMELPESVRPDALIIDDDNLVEDATAGLLASGVNVPAELEVVAHCNVPLLPKAQVPVRFLGFDSRRVMETCIEMIDRQRQGLEVPSMTWIEPEFVVAGELLQ